MSKKAVHIVAFDIPFPPTYGGVIDIFHKIRCLHKMGVEIFLHAFEYNRSQASELALLCKEIYYYPRTRHPILLLKSQPFIVASRMNKNLEKRLLEDNYPILFEGLHTCAALLNPDIQKKHCIVRTHNIEHEYYRALAMHNTGALKQWYYLSEARKLSAFEQILARSSGIAAISSNDASYFNRLFGYARWIPPFHPEDSVTAEIGKGDYALYHGNLMVEENNRSALFLIEQIFSKIHYRLIIAGQTPSKTLKNAISKYKHVQWVAPESQEQMNALISDAQMHVLPSFQSTGIKLKLLHALYKGRHCIVNDTMLEGTGLNNLCVIANNSDEWITAIERLQTVPFQETDLRKREQGLQTYDNYHAAVMLGQMLWLDQE